MSTTSILVGTTRLNADLRHEVPVETHDPTMFVAHEGRRVIVARALEQPRLAASGPHDFMSLEELGREAMLTRLGSPAAADREAMCTAIRQLGITAATVPSDFPLAFARTLEQEGIELRVDDEVFAAARRRKTAGELAGIGRAQAAADAAVSALRSVLARADRPAGRLVHDSEPLTSERLKHLVRRELAEHGAGLDEFILSHGEQTAIGHHTGAGQIRVGEPIIVDLWPLDQQSACCTDMTRTIVVGEPPGYLREWEARCSEVLELVLARVRPGAKTSDLHAAACELFEAHGHPTPLSHRGEETLLDGFPWPLGHGVGLALHEAPLLRLGTEAELLEGEILAIEPALYRQGLGGYRTEDVYVVGRDDPRRLGTLPTGLLVVP